MVEKNDKIWKKFLRKHWKMLAVIIVAAILAFIGAIRVFLWHVDQAQSTGLVPEYLQLWSMGNIIAFLLHLIFWVFVFIGIPVIIAAVAIYFLWWKKIPDNERKEYRRAHLFGKRSRRTDGEGAISFFIFIVFCIKVFLDGRWDVGIGSWKFNYLVESCLWALFWVAIIIGIPILIGATWWIRHQMKKET